MGNHTLLNSVFKIGQHTIYNTMANIKNLKYCIVYQSIDKMHELYITSLIFTET